MVQVVRDVKFIDHELRVFESNQGAIYFQPLRDVAEGAWVTLRRILFAVCVLEYANYLGEPPDTNNANPLFWLDRLNEFEGVLRVRLPDGQDTLFLGPWDPKPPMFCSKPPPAYPKRELRSWYKYVSDWILRRKYKTPGSNRFRLLAGCK